MATMVHGALRSPSANSVRAGQELEVCRLVEGKWLQLGVFGTDEKVRAEPFEAVEIDLAEWWEGLDEDDED
jgi:hypothetical protein